MISVNASDWEGLEGMGEEMLDEIRPKAERVMWDAGTRFQAALREKLSGPRSGRTYWKGRTVGIHQASAPGEPPAVLSGALRNSMGFSRPRWQGWSLEMEVGSGLGVGRDVPSDEVDAYARRLEWGGYSFHPWPVYIAPRPYLEPTAQIMDPILQRLFEAGL